MGQSLKASVPMVSTPLPMVTDVRWVQPQNASISITEILLGMLIDVRAQLENILPLMLVILSGMVIEFKQLQSKNAASPMLITLSGIVIVVALQPLNAYLPMVVTSFPMVIELTSHA